MANEIKRATAEALAIAKGESPAARIYHNGHFYVPQAEVERLRAALREIAKHPRGGVIDTLEKMERDEFIGIARAALGEKP